MALKINTTTYIVIGLTVLVLLVAILSKHSILHDPSALVYVLPLTFLLISIIVAKVEAGARFGYECLPAIRMKKDKDPVKVPMFVHVLGQVFLVGDIVNAILLHTCTPADITKTVATGRAEIKLYPLP